MTDKQTSKWSLLGLGALSVGSIASIAAAHKSTEQPEKVPPVDALTEEPPGGGEWPFVSIVVPARNEERNLPRLLPSILAMRYPSFEVIVVDDQSEDATPRILEEWTRKSSRLKVVRGVTLPKHEGWMGKPHAMHQGAQAARGEWLLFTDADTVHTSLSLSSALAFALRHGVDLFTITPDVELVTAAERMVMPVAFQGIAYLYPPYKVNDPRSRVAIANGQYLLVRREVYDAVGGAERVKSQIAEDLEFGKAVKGDGYRLFIASGRDLMKVRMYTNLPEMWEGWRKNAVLSFRNNPASGVMALAGIGSLTLMPVLLVRWSVLRWRGMSGRSSALESFTTWWVTALTAWNITAPIVYRRSLDRQIGLPAGWALTQPLGLAIFMLIMLDAVVRLALGKGVTWKGRTYANRE